MVGEVETPDGVEKCYPIGMSVITKMEFISFRLSELAAETKNAFTAPCRLGSIGEDNKRDHEQRTRTSSEIVARIARLIEKGECTAHETRRAVRRSRVPCPPSASTRDRALPALAERGASVNRGAPTYAHRRA